MNLLDNIIVVDFSQFLSGPSASLSLADLGAEVIKIEKPDVGDICRELYVSDVMIDGESSIFHAINRNKKSYVADLKCDFDVEKINQLIKQADVVMHNFRPGVMERLGFGYEQVKKINPSIIYASISGYGENGPWKKLPGQDLLLQAISGLTWLNNSADSNPTPMGVSVVDMLAGAHLAQGILALLYQKGVSGEGGSVQISMLESAMDFQFEVLTCYFNDGGQLPQRSAVNSGHVYVAAPYGIYKTKDAYIALAMANIVTLSQLIACDGIKCYQNENDWFEKRDEIKSILADHLAKNTTDHWLNILEPAGIWCSRVFNYEQLTKEEGYHALDMEIVVKSSNGISVKTTRSPIIIDGQSTLSCVGAPGLGEHNEEVDIKFNLNAKPEIARSK